MTLKRMDNVLIVVEDLEAAKAFFAELGMELEGETLVEGPWVDATVGLDGVRADIAMMRTPDGHGRAELTRFHTPPAVRAEPESAPANALGIRRIMFAVEDLDDVIARLRTPRCRARRRDRAVRGQLPALLRAWPRGLHRRAGRAPQLNLDGRSRERPPVGESSSTVADATRQRRQSTRRTRKRGPLVGAACACCRRRARGGGRARPW
jgi:catechol 2,3-dioxygenase-like lactoylglutathione lyase family enzyme